MTFATDFKLINLLHAQNANPTNEDLNTSLDEPKQQWNIHLVSYDILTSRAKPSTNGQLSHCSWSFGIFDESHRYKTNNSVGWQIAMNARIGFELHITATPGFHALYDWCFQTMWLFSSAPEYPEDDTVIEKHGAETLYSAVKSLMHAIQTENKRHSTGPGTSDDPNCKAVDDQEVVRIETCEWDTTCFDSEGECTPC